jgi:hypothetical protein
MSKPLVYLDQNIIGLIANKEINIKPSDDFIFTYSKEHFREIHRSKSPELYLNALHQIDAKLLDLELDQNWKITGKALLKESGTPTELYSEFLDTISDVDLSEDIFDSFLAWVNGGGNKESLECLPDLLSEQIFEITKDLTNSHVELTDKLLNITQDFKGVINNLIENGNDIIKTRSALGNDKGAVGSVLGENIIEKIWSIVQPTSGGLTCDEFFGFNPKDKQGYDIWPMYLGIVGSCAVMDIIGFQTEKKCRNIDKLPNVRSNSGHIGMGAFCSLVILKDKRLVKRANAIYKYKGINSSATVL